MEYAKEARIVSVIRRVVVKKKTRRPVDRAGG
jgi:hypothetical protein